MGRCDPGTSRLEFPGYRTPRWLDAEPLPLLAVHDGPELDCYAAITRYSGALIGSRELPAIRERFAGSSPVVLAGASLGALAALHAEWRHPGTVGALFCQSGSFFTPRLDPQEGGYPWFGRITAFTAAVAAAPAAASRPPVALTCGRTEENAANNRAIAQRLAELGCPRHSPSLTICTTSPPGGDALDPHLTGLLRRVWEVPGAA